MDAVDRAERNANLCSRAFYAAGIVCGLSTIEALKPTTPTTGFVAKCVTGASLATMFGLVFAQNHYGERFRDALAERGRTSAQPGSALEQP